MEEEEDEEEEEERMPKTPYSPAARAGYADDVEAKAAEAAARYLAAERARPRQGGGGGRRGGDGGGGVGRSTRAGAGDGDDGSDSEEGSFDASISCSSLTSSPSLDEGERSPRAPYTAGNAAGTPPAKLSLHPPDARAAARGWCDSGAAARRCLSPAMISLAQSEPGARPDWGAAVDAPPLRWTDEWLHEVAATTLTTLLGH